MAMIFKRYSQKSKDFPRPWKSPYCWKKEEDLGGKMLSYHAAALQGSGPVLSFEMKENKINAQQWRGFPLKPFAPFPRNDLQFVSSKGAVSPLGLSSEPMHGCILCAIIGHE